MDKIFKEAEKESDYLISLHLYEYYKLLMFKDQSNLIEEVEDNFKIDTFLKKNDKNQYILEIPDDKLDLYHKQAFNQSIIFMGVALFEKYCRDWFAWGLRYSPNRIREYGNNRIEIYKLLDSDKPKNVISMEMAKKIQCQKADNCRKQFDKIFNFDLFGSDEIMKEFNHFIIDRHAISHNCGFIDHKYIQEKNLPDNTYGNLILLSDSTIDKFLGYIQVFMDRFITDFREIIFEEIKKNEHY